MMWSNPLVEAAKANLGTGTHGTTAVTGMSTRSLYHYTKDITAVQQLLKHLASKGLGDNTLRRIAYENALRIIKETLP